MLLVILQMDTILLMRYQIQQSNLLAKNVEQIVQQMDVITLEVAAQMQDVMQDLDTIQLLNLANLALLAALLALQFILHALQHRTDML